MKLKAASHESDLYNLLVADKVGFQHIAKILKEIAGINLVQNSKNEVLVASRLTKILRTYELDNYKEYIDFLKSHSDKRNEFISALTTNTTHFFREAQHFDVLNELIRERMRKNPNKIHTFDFWCCATSTGQEIYSIIMSLNKEFGDQFLDRTQILATDIDLAILKRAKSAIYKKEDIGDLKKSFLTLYFEALENQCYRFKSKFRRNITFGRFNLISNPYGLNNSFDFIFCRNVLIYFDRATIRGIIQNLTDSLKPGGFLFVGHSEMGAVSNPNLVRHTNAVFQKKANG